MGNLDALGVGGEEPASEEGVDDVVVGLVVDQVGTADPVADRRAGVGQRHQPQEDGACDLSAVGGKLVEDAVGGGRHRALHTAARLIARHGEDAVLPMGPGLGQRVRQQRQGARLALDVAQEQVDEPRFEAEPSACRRTGDGRPYLRLGHGAEEVQTVLDQSRQRREPAHRGHEVGAQRQDDRCPHGATGQPVGEGGPLGRRST